MIVEINLLSWRKRAREREKKKFIRIFLSLLIFAVSIVLFMNHKLHSNINRQVEENQYLRKEIDRLNDKQKAIKRIKKKNKLLLHRLIFLKNIHNNRLLTVHLFDEIIKVMSKDIYLTKIQRIGNKIIITGFSQTTNAITLLTQRMESNPWMKSPAVMAVKNKHMEGNIFKLSFILQQRTQAYE
ncbi:PilN domain-containing protein [Legionella fairfieldensis]|uniref:PilN domain-containing protein n=1 Tax=Legionella fairfieldensis TaxID=45064 RepID=UPI00048D6C23|nr:PilN domain-containing protein [Legionella fairfieldensis]